MLNIDTIIQNNINKFLVKEGLKESSNKVLYHQTSFSIPKLQSILKNGLIPRDNGESNAVWFNVGGPFYPNDKRLMTFSVNFTKEFKRSHFCSDDISRVLVHDIVEPYYLNIVDCPICVDEKNNVILSTSTNVDLLKNFAKRRENNTIAEYIINNPNLKDRKLIIIGELFEQYIEKGTLYMFIKQNNIKVISLWER